MQTTNGIWGLLRRNGISGLFCKKWLREELSKSAMQQDIEESEIDKVEKKWLREKKIGEEKFLKDRRTTLIEHNLTEDDFSLYCRNEILSRKWAFEVWEGSIPQIFLEKKDEYDKVKLEMLSVPTKNKGLILEIYQRLAEKESNFNEIGDYFKQAKYITEKDGTWFKKSDLRKEIRFTVENLKIMNYSKPIKLEERFVLIGLTDTINSKLDESIEASIIDKELEKFIRYGASDYRK